MAVITAIEACSKRKGGVNVFIDGEYFASFNAASIADLRLFTGKEIDGSDYAELLFNAERDRAYGYAVNYLSSYSATEKIMRRKLHDKGYSAQTVQWVADKLKEYNYINDYEYALSFALARAKDCGRFKLYYDLRERGVDGDIINVALEDAETDDYASGYAVAVRYMRGKDIDNYKDKAKLYNYLRGRGFDGDVFSYCVKELKANEN